MCTTTGIIVKVEAGKASVFPLRCKSWSCETCAPLRRRALIKEAKDGKPNRFITLTVNPNWFADANDRAARLAKAWRLIVAAYRHRWPTREAEYMAVFEATKRGEPHLHIMWRGGWMDQKWLSAQMEERMGAPIVDVRQVFRSAKVAEYVSKYLSKRNVKFGNCKRYWRSKHYLEKSLAQQRAERNAGASFMVHRHSLLKYLDMVLRTFRCVTFLNANLFEFSLHDWERAPPDFTPDGCWLPPSLMI